MNETLDIIKCPRCNAGAIVGGNGALSRTTRDDGAEVMVCNRCGKREALYGRDPDAQRPLTDWPLPLDALVAEERELLQRERESWVAVIPADELDLP